MLSDAYAAFINHYLQAKEAVRTAAIQRPAFSKFLEVRNFVFIAFVCLFVGFQAT